jgi:type VI protein secretion system component VasK
MEDKKKGFHPLRKFKAFIGKIGTLNLILILVGAFFVWFNWQMLEIFREYACIPETYACAVIASTIGEAGICGWIRTTKDKKRDHQWEQEEKKAVESAETKEMEDVSHE